VSQQTPLHNQTTAAGAQYVDEAGWLVPAHHGAPETEYQQARSGAVLFDVSSRGKVELVGPEAKSFLHNLCSNDMAGLKVGEGREAFLATAKAKVVIRFVGYRGTPEGKVEHLWLDVDPGFAARTVQHLDHYLISEQVELLDRTNDFAQLHLAGPTAPALLERFLGEAPGLNVLQSRELSLNGVPLQVRRHDPLGLPGFDLLVAPAQAGQVGQALRDAGALPAGRDVYQVLRIEAGTPLQGQDIDDNTLAMDLGRTAQAISYTKGCFPGQEPIVRSRDLGHPNWSFRGLKVSGVQTVPLGTPLTREGQEVGRVTSVGRTPRGLVALAAVRRGSDAPGTRLELVSAGERGSAEVCSLPFSE
jgi:folate-binding protein YgfZ